MQGALNGQARYTIRGISSQSGSIGYAPTGATVGVYLDGTPVTAALGPDNQVSGTLFDIERVEVLKGPQGTLFGEGSQGGTIRYIYKKPDATGFDAAVNLGFSSMEESDDMSNRIDGMINVPLSDNAAFRLTAWRSTTAGDRVCRQPGAVRGGLQRGAVHGGSCGRTLRRRHIHGNGYRAPDRTGSRLPDVGDGLVPSRFEFMRDRDRACPVPARPAVARETSGTGDHKVAPYIRALVRAPNPPRPQAI